MKKIVLISIPVTLFILIICLFFFKGNNSTNIVSLDEEENYEETVENIISNISNNKSKIDYAKYINIKLVSCSFVYNNTNEQRTEDKDNCDIVYTVYFKNISNEDIDFNYRIFIPDELTSRIVYSPTYVGPSGMKNILKPGKGVTIAYSAIMKHTNKLDEEEKILLDKYKNTLYIEMRINHKAAYTELN